MLQTAVIAKRLPDGEPETAEIRQLTETAGARVVGEVTQQRERDPGTVLGSGKVDEIAAIVERNGADTVVIDEPVTPQQTVTLEARTGARVIDRYRLVLEIFARQARSRRAQLQVKLARLRYRLPRVRERTDEGMLNRRTESGTRYYDLLDRIDELERQIDDLPPVGEQFERRREEGLDLIAIAGYTNAGKSTLLRRLANEMSVVEDTHDDLEQSATAADRLFETLETTTRRATIDDRETLLTDTVGFLDELPHWLVDSFGGTLSAVEHADVALVVVDGSQPADQIERKLTTTIETLTDDHPVVVPVLNKADLVDEDEMSDRRDAVTELLSDQIGERYVEPVCISATGGDGFEPLEARIRQALPDLERASFSLPLTDDGLSVLSRLHDEATEIDVQYGSERVAVELGAQPTTVEQLRARVEEVSEQAP